MAHLKPRELRQQEPDKLRQTLFDLRAEYSKLEGNKERGLVQKDVGKVRRVRRDIARVLTIMREKGVTE